MRIVLCTAVIAACLACLGIAYAQEPTPDAAVTAAAAPAPAPPAEIPSTVVVTPPAEPALGRLAQQVFEIVAYVLGTLLIGLIAMLVRAAEKKFKVDVPDRWEQKLLGEGGWADQGLNYAEEQGRKFLKGTAKKMEMNTSLEHAANYVLDVADARQVKKMGKDKLKKILESRLNMKRAAVPNGTTPR